MYHVYTEKDGNEFSRTLVGEFTDYDKAVARGEKSIQNKDNYIWLIEETDGHVNNYGELITTVIARSDDR